MVKLYHYTNFEGYSQIWRTKVIKKSESFTRDCRYGAGVYLTSMNPSDHDKEEIARNNYSQGWQKNMSIGKLDHYIEIDIPNYDVHLTKCNEEGRDVYRYKKDIYLDRYLIYLLILLIV